MHLPRGPDDQLVFVGTQFIFLWLFGNMLKHLVEVGPSPTANLPPFAGQEFDDHVTGNPMEPASKRGRISIVLPSLDRMGDRGKQLLGDVRNISFGNPLAADHLPQKGFICRHKLRPGKLVALALQPEDQALTGFGLVHERLGARRLEHVGGRLVVARTAISPALRSISPGSAPILTPKLEKIDIFRPGGSGHPRE